MIPEKMMPVTKPSAANRREKGRSESRPGTRASRPPAKDHATPQMRPIPIAPRTRRTQVRMTTSRVESPCQVLGTAKYHRTGSRQTPSGGDGEVLCNQESTALRVRRVDSDRSRSTCEWGRVTPGNHPEPNSGENDAFPD